MQGRRFEEDRKRIHCNTLRMFSSRERPRRLQIVCRSRMALLGQTPMSKYSNMTVVQSEFRERADSITVHGLGLSVDVYSPDLLQLDDLVRHRGIAVDYYEVFQAALPALRAVKERLAGRCLAYHGEGLWVSQPDYNVRIQNGSAVSEVCAQLRALESQWLNIECATKQMAGVSFGTYLPPLYTREGTVVAAENAVALQREIDRDFVSKGSRLPLLLLEMPPLTYFGWGSLSIPSFFHDIVRRASCGLVLDIGHLWTVYRYTGAWRLQSVEQFLAEFLDSFPMDRVIEIHVAGLAEHPIDAGERGPDYGGGALPRWIDAHGQPIPELLFDMLDQVLSHPRLAALKGLALEVDTKEPALILSEFETFHRRFNARFTSRGRDVPADRGPSFPATCENVPAESHPDRQAYREGLALDYDLYARVVTGQAEWTALSERVRMISDAEGLALYQNMYLPYEILHWGGDLMDMFPHTCKIATERAVDIRDFVTFWFERTRVPSEAYDFFLMKIDYFVEFIASVLPDAVATAVREAEELRTAYGSVNQKAGFEEITT